MAASLRHHRARGGRGVSLVVIDTGEVLDAAGHLDALADRIRTEHARGTRALADALEAKLVIGRCLQEARDAIPSDQAFGAWFRAQEFGFTMQWAGVLRSAARNEPEVRAAVETQVSTGDSPNFRKVVKQVAAAAIGATVEPEPKASAKPVGLGHSEPATDEPQAEPTVFPTIVIDPPWRYDNKTTRGAAEDHYPTMDMDELRAMVLPSADQAHLYLWVTNPFLREGFELLDAWGFTYKTTLTWTKPQMGMGNYFRSATEHVLFAIKGGMGTDANNIMTWFSADRQRHSQKPELFYDIVEASSPGPFLEMFARRRRFGWSVWGNEA